MFIFTLVGTDVDVHHSLAMQIYKGGDSLPAGGEPKQEHKEAIPPTRL